MADGDFSVLELGRSAYQAGGSNLAGSPKNDKMQAFGKVTFTYNTGGLVITPSRFGFSTLDFFAVTSIEANNDTAATAAAPFIPAYLGKAEVPGNLIITDDAGTEATDSQTGSFSYHACGSALNADLT